MSTQALIDQEDADRLREAIQAEPLRRRENVVYICGPMSGLPEYNYPAFRDVAEQLRERGYTVVSPVELDEDDGYHFDTNEENWDKPTEYAIFLSRDIKVIAEKGVEVIVVLPGWEKSGGARTEVAFGQALGLPIRQWPSLEEIGQARKDQGEVRITNDETGGEKGRKPQRFELLPWTQLARVAELYAEGASKYADHNWRQGYAWSLSFGAMQRHAALFWEGEEYDPETGCHHMTAVVFHALALLQFEQEHPELDDRAVTTLAKED